MPEDDSDDEETGTIPHERAYPEPIQPMPPSAGTNSISPKIMPASQVVKNMDRLRHDTMASWSGIAALRNLVDDTMPEDQQTVVDAGAARAIIETMQAFPDHAGIQVCGSGTLVKVAEVDANARRIVLEAGGIFELAAAVTRLEKHSDTDGDKMGKHVVHKANFARDCLLKVAGKRSDPRNKKHIQAAIAGGVDPALFNKLDPKVRDKMEEDAHANFLVRKAAQAAADDEAEHEMLMRCPWAQTLERDREICVVFSGQGAQKKGMADTLVESSPEAKALFEQASKILGYDLYALTRDGPVEKLDQTLYSQPAIFVTSLAAIEKAKRDKYWLDKLGRTKVAAGFSLGEYAALVYGEAISFEDGLRLVQARAEAMDAAAKEADGCMASISGVDDQQLVQCIAAATQEVGGEGKAYIANYMFPEGRTCSGDREVLKRLCEKVTAMGSGKSGKLVAVSGAFHTPYMASAVPKLAAKLDATEIKLPTIGILSNVTGAYYQSAEQIKELLKRQIVEPVRWEQTMEVACKGTYGVAGYIESGPGKQLRAMMRRIDADCWGKMVVLE